MEHLYADGGTAHLLVGAAEHPVGRHQQVGAYTFASETEGVLNGVVELTGFTRELLRIEYFSDFVEHGYIVLERIVDSKV